MDNIIYIKYIYHSCFSIETHDSIIIFDYFKGGLPKNPKNKKVYFIVSHAHHDHFNKKIFQYGDFNKNEYILSFDIKELERKENVIMLGDVESMKTIYNHSNVHFMKVDDYLKIDSLIFRSFGSTDEGISIFMQTPHLNFFHAGDLNNWMWDYYSPEEKEKMQADFSREIDKIKHRIDIAFFPVDPRLGKNYALGVTEFVEKHTPQVLFPMHFGGEEEFSEKFIRDYTFPLTQVKMISDDDEAFKIILN